MINLPNNCWCSEFGVYPKNWKTAKADLSKTWYIQYYFHDPAFKDEQGYRYGKMVLIKSGINRLKTLAERQEAVKALIEAELYLLQVEGYNPITKKKAQEKRQTDFVKMGFVEALNFAYDSKSCERHTKEDLKSVVKYAKQAIRNLRLEDLEISKVEKAHAKMILQEVGAIKGKRWTNNNYNYYRAHLGMLFQELKEYDAVKYNVFLELASRKRERKARVLLSQDQRKAINKKLKEEDYCFWRFVQIFFHSGARESEMVLLKGKHVDLEAQQFLISVKKGKEVREVWKPIKDVALPYWQEIMEDCTPEMYVFSLDLKPMLRAKPIRAEYITKRWKKLVKEGMGIEADFYSLKHLNTDETAALLGIEAAAAQNSHTTTVITMKHYALGEKARQMERLKKVGNSFA